MNIDTVLQIAATVAVGALTVMLLCLTVIVAFATYTLISELL